jgi:uncharacterized protein YndB with AHSA1/START domain
MVGDQVGGPIRWRMHIPVPPAEVFRALDTNDGRARFWAESADEQGGVIDFRFANGVRYRARILERRPPERLVLDYFGARLDIEVTSDGSGGTDLLLTHVGVSDEEWQEVHAGWLNVLFPLKAALAFGVDLRNHDPSRSWDQGYADQ